MLCKVCGIRKITEELYQPSYGKMMTGASVKNIICRYAKTTGCINKTEYSSEMLTGADSWEKRQNLGEK